MTGTNTNIVERNPNPYGLFNTTPQNLANCNIILVRVKGQKEINRIKNKIL